MTTKSLTEALQVFKNGGFVIVTDDEKRENEGDLFLLASAATTEKLGFMIRYTSGVICVPMTEARSRELHLPLMVKRNQDTLRTAFTVTVDAKAGMTTGISAEERARTIRTLADTAATSEDFVRPGHIFPLIAHGEGLVGRQGHTEAVIEMCRMVGEVEVGVLSELVNEDGSMMRGNTLIEFSRAQNIPIVTIADLVNALKSAVKGEVETSTSPHSFSNTATNQAPNNSLETLHWADLPRSSRATWRIATYTGRGGVDHAILTLGLDSDRNRPTQGNSTLVRVHSECLTGDVLGSLRCDCGSQLERAMKIIEEAGTGVVIYLRDHEGRGIGLTEKIRAYELQDRGLDTIEANLALGHDVDERDFADAAEILEVLGIREITLLTNNPTKVQNLQRAGLKVSAQKLHGETNKFNQKYIETKRERLGHQ